MAVAERKRYSRHTLQITCWVEPGLKERIDEYLEETGMSQSAMVRMAVLKFLQSE
jgi:hypothetical protein